MKNEYTIRNTIKILDDLARGIDPFTGEALPETDVVNDIRVSRYLFTALGVLRERQESADTVSRKQISDDETLDLKPDDAPVNACEVRRPRITKIKFDPELLAKLPEKEKPPRETDTEGILFYLESRDGLFSGKLVVTPEGKYILKAGTRVSLEVKSNFRSSNAVRSRREMVGISDSNPVLEKDVPFKSSTAAGEFVCGSTCDGPFRWKTSDGVRMQDLPEMESILKSKTETNILKEID